MRREEKTSKPVGMAAAIARVEETYRLTALFPTTEIYGLAAQMRRAAISIPSTIAEGAVRNGSREFVHFLGIARGFLSELDTQLTTARNIGYLADLTNYEKSMDEIFALLGGLINSLRVTKP